MISDSRIKKKKERLAESTSRFQAHEHRRAGDVRSRQPPWDCVRSSDGATANAQGGFQFRLSLNWTYLDMHMHKLSSSFSSSSSPSPSPSVSPSGIPFRKTLRWIGREKKRERLETLQKATLLPKLENRTVWKCDPTDDISAHTHTHTHTHTPGLAQRLQLRNTQRLQ